MSEKAPQDTESRHADKYIVRFPDGMRDRLKTAAQNNNRTLNAELVARLDASFQTQDKPFGQAARERLEEVKRRYEWLMMRNDVLKSRVESLLLRVDVIEESNRHLEENTQNEADVARYKANGERLVKMLDDVKSLLADIEKISVEQKALETEADEARAAMTAVNEQLEKRIAEAQAKQIA